MPVIGATGKVRFCLKSTKPFPRSKCFHPLLNSITGCDESTRTGNITFTAANLGFLAGNGGNGAVYLRDLVNKTNITLVPPDSSGQYALARFYSNSRDLFQKPGPYGRTGI